MPPVGTWLVPHLSSFKSEFASFASVRHNSTVRSKTAAIVGGPNPYWNGLAEIIICFSHLPSVPRCAQRSGKYSSGSLFSSDGSSKKRERDNEYLVVLLRSCHRVESTVVCKENRAVAAVLAGSSEAPPKRMQLTKERVLTRQCLYGEGCPIHYLWRTSSKHSLWYDP
jgi:hypothetical protein